jgi:hypothetical protein
VSKSVPASEYRSTVDEQSKRHFARAEAKFKSHGRTPADRCYTPKCTLGRKAYFFKMTASHRCMWADRFYRNVSPRPMRGLKAHCELQMQQVANGSTRTPRLSKYNRFSCPDSEPQRCKRSHRCPSAPIIRCMPYLFRDTPRLRVTELPDTGAL